MNDKQQTEIAVETTKKKKYITLDSGVDFRGIARIMSRNSFPMNHATARNQVIQAMNNLFITAGKKLGVELSPERLGELLKKQEIHDSLVDVLWTAHGNMLREESNKKESK
jgi:hypothetical protein